MSHDERLELERLIIEVYAGWLMPCPKIERVEFGGEQSATAITQVLVSDREVRDILGAEFCTDIDHYTRSGGDSMTSTQDMNLNGYIDFVQDIDLPKPIRLGRHIVTNFLFEDKGEGGEDAGGP